MRLAALLGVLVLTFVVLHGCARTPSGTVTTPKREITFNIVFNAPINEAYYYFVAIDTTGGGPYPTPVFPDINTGDRWLTGSATHFVRYHQGQYTVFKINNLDSFDITPIGAPLRYDRLNPSALSFTLDLNVIEASNESLDVNIITCDQLSAPSRLLDAIGQSGTQYLEIGITSDHEVINQGIEPTDDVLDQNGVHQRSSDLTRPLDIKDFTINVDV